MTCDNAALRAYRVLIIHPSTFAGQCVLPGLRLAASSLKL